MNFTRDQVSQAVNRAANLVSEVRHDEADLLNLMVNATLASLDDPGCTLDQAIERNYDDPPEVVRGWIN